MTGSKPKRGAPAGVNIPVRVTPEERERYRTAAEALGVTLSDVAREAWERMAKREGGSDAR